MKNLMKITIVLFPYLMFWYSYECLRMNQRFMAFAVLLVALFSFLVGLGINVKENKDGKVD